MTALTEGKSRPTPACAGSTSVVVMRDAYLEAYPRLRGEHFNDRTDGREVTGLPPLARGARRLWRRRYGDRRPTPACAGSTTAAAMRTSTRTAYPRLRGEHPVSAVCRVSVTGLPPLARGARGSHGLERTVTGPTPACAGSTRRQRARAHSHRAYPRLRGEHSAESLSQHQPQGLPPLARGARSVGVRLRDRLRPTPACAGSTPSQRESA